MAYSFGARTALSSLHPIAAAVVFPLPLREKKNYGSRNAVNFTSPYAAWLKSPSWAASARWKAGLAVQRST